MRRECGSSTVPNHRPPETRACYVVDPHWHTAEHLDDALAVFFRGASPF
jgi:hypothetical protein